MLSSTYECVGPLRTFHPLLTSRFTFQTLAGFLFCVVFCGFGVFVALLCFCFLFCKCFGIPNSPRSLDLDDRQGLIASSAMQQKKKLLERSCIFGETISLFFFWLVAAWVKSRAERPSVSGVNRQLHVQIGCKLRIRNRKDELTKQAKRNKLQIKPEGN